MPDLILIINADADSPAAARMVSRSDRRPAGFRDLILGERLTLRLYVIDATGAFHPCSGAAGYFPRLALGHPGQPALVQIEPTAFTPVEGQPAWQSILSLNTPDLAAQLQQGERRRFALEFEVTDPDGLARKYLQAELYIRHRVIDPRILAPADAPAYLTAAESRALFLQNRLAVTRLTGGTADALDGIASATVAAGSLAIVYLAATKDLLLFRCVAGETLANAPYEIPFADAPAAKYWQLIAYLGRDANPAVWNDEQAKWHRLQAAGPAGLEYPVFSPGYDIPTE